MSSVNSARRRAMEVTSLEVDQMQARALELLLLRAAGAELEDVFQSLLIQGIALDEGLSILRLAQRAGMSLSISDGHWLSGVLRQHGWSIEERLHHLHDLYDDPIATIQLAYAMVLDRETWGVLDVLTSLGIEPISLAMCCEDDSWGEALLAALKYAPLRGMAVPAWGRSAADTTAVFKHQSLPPECMALVSPRSLGFVDCTFPTVLPPIHSRRIWIKGGRGGRRLGCIQTSHLEILNSEALERLPRPLVLDTLILKDCPRLKLDDSLAARQRLELDNLPVLERWPAGLFVRDSLKIRNCPRLDLPEELPVAAETVLVNLPGLRTISDKAMVSHALTIEACSLESLPASIRGGGKVTLRFLRKAPHLQVGFTVEGDLELAHSPLVQLPKAMKVGGVLTLIGLETLSSLPSDLEVRGDIRVINCPSLAGRWSAMLRNRRDDTGVSDA